MGYEIKSDKEKGTVLVCGDNQKFTKEDCDKLWKEEKIYFNKGLFAVMVEERKNNTPLCTLGMEEDGYIYFGKDCTHFALAWLGDLKGVINGLFESWASLVCDGKEVRHEAC